MKKTIILSLIFTLLGTLTGLIINTNDNKQIKTFNEEKKYYFLQEGIYSNEKNMLENTKELDSKLVINENNKYYVYLGITKEEKIAQKIKNIYQNKGYSLYIKEINIDNEEFYNNVTQFDLLINNTNKENEILTIEEVVLANYEEIILNQ